MNYLDRTEEVRHFLLGCTGELKRIRRLIGSHYGCQPKERMWATGSTRAVYDLGNHELPGKGKFKLLLKLGRFDEGIWDEYFRWQRIEEDETDPENSTNSYSALIYSELGSFDLYCDYLTGSLTHAEYRSEDNELARDRNPYSIKETDRLYVEPGDLGAIPYFHMVVRADNWFGVLTEGNPCLISPNNRSHPDLFDHTMSGGRIVDLFPSANYLSKITNEEMRDCFGIWARGKRYFEPRYRLEL
jgi:hypothetical protein